MRGINTFLFCFVFDNMGEKGRGRKGIFFSFLPSRPNYQSCFSPFFISFLFLSCRYDPFFIFSETGLFRRRRRFVLLRVVLCQKFMFRVLPCRFLIEFRTLNHFLNFPLPKPHSILWFPEEIFFFPFVCLSTICRKGPSLSTAPFLLPPYSLFFLFSLFPLISFFWVVAFCFAFFFFFGTGLLDNGTALSHLTFLLCFAFFSFSFFFFSSFAVQVTFPRGEKRVWCWKRPKPVC